jgi:hypothetical protein
MKKSTFLIILFILAYGYLEYLPFIKINSDLNLVLQWLFMFYALVRYHKYSTNPLNISANKKYVSLFIVLMVISSLIPFFEYNQSILSTLLAQRQNYNILFLFVLLYIHPTPRDFFIALRFCSFLCLVIMILSIFFPEYFLDSKKFDSFSMRANRGSKDLITASPGINLVFFYFLIKIQSWFTFRSQKNLKEIVFIFIMIFLLQNRSLLLITIPIFIYSVIKLKSKYKFLTWFIIFIIFIFISNYLLSIFDSLWEESISQFENKNYNRWEAISFFILEPEFNFLELIFGHGVPSKEGDYLDFIQTAQNNRNAYLSDIGLLGTFYLYGLAFIIPIYLFVFKALKKQQPKFLKFFALYVLFVPTIQRFGNLSSDAAIFYSMFFYLVIYYEKYNPDIKSFV